MSDRQVVVVAVLTVLGAWRAQPLPWLLVVLVAAVAVAMRRPLAVGLAAALVASFLGARSWAGVTGAPTSGAVSGPATVVADPTWVRGSVRLELRLDGTGRRVQASAGGDAGALLGSRLAGERLRVEGRLAPVSEASRAYLARRHVGSRLSVTSATDPEPGGPVTRFANQLRRTLADGAGSMSPERRALFTGLVIGDDRGQDPLEVDDFRGSGLTHLLAVSGQNVAFVLAVAAPFVRRLGLRGRLVAGTAVLVVFGVVTRWEPSVLRAVSMAGLALVAATAGRPASSIRVLGLAVTGLVLVDPMLAGSIGFLLSVGACTGIALLGPWLERRRVPAPLAVTLAAQVGVAPVLIPVFGTVPLASLPANLLAEPAAGPVMMWGLVGGLPAGLVGGRVAWLLHLPTRVLLAWISGVARVAAASPLPQVDGRGALAIVAVAAAGAVVVWLRGVRTAVVAVVVLLVAAGVVPGLLRHPPEDDGREIAAGVRLWRRGGAVVLVVAGNADVGRLAEAVRTRRIRRVDVLVLRSGGSGSARLSAALRRRCAVRLALAPTGHSVPGAQAPAVGQRVAVGALEVAVERDRPRLDVRVGSPGHAPRPRAP